MEKMTGLSDDQTVVQRILDHIDNSTTDLSESTLREPVEHYRSAARFAAERDLVLRRYPVAFCPSAALPGPGSYLARSAAGTPLVAVRGTDGSVRAFRNACRHRGTQVADGTGCAKAFICPYHGWTYDLDGRLRHVPDAHGFPGLDQNARGLVPIACVERHGVVFVTQDAASGVAGDLPDLPTLIAPGWNLLAATEQEIPANWKILAEGFLEGYHIRATHAQTFYPVQFDNLNLVETFGRNSRVTFPYRAINKLRKVPAAERSVDGKLTYVYHLFPNVMLATFAANVFLVVLEPLTIERTLLITYVLGKPSDGEVPQDAKGPETIKRGLDLINAGAVEDRAVACSIQRGLGSGANEFFEFGRFEGAIVHFHHALHAAIDGTPRGERE